MLRNICKAKFEKILMPIAEQVIAPELLPYVTFDTYFNEILLHEISHGLGPGTIKLPDGIDDHGQQGAPGDLLGDRRGKSRYCGGVQFLLSCEGRVFP